MQWEEIHILNNYTVNIRGNSIFCQSYGNGNELILAFHGFGEKHNLFEPILSSFKKYKIIAIDLPLHGNTQWNIGELFSKNDLQKLIEIILEREQKTTFSLMGYSLGGKIALSSLEFFSEKIKTLILIAPDGLSNNVWYNIAIYPKWGKKLFHYIVKNPTILFWIMKAGVRLKIINETLLKFTQFQMATNEKRQLIYDVYTTIDDFSFNKKRISNFINHNKIKTLLIFGKYDKVILPKYGKNFKKMLHNYELEIVNKGHLLINEELNYTLQNSKII